DDVEATLLKLSRLVRCLKSFNGDVLHRNLAIRCCDVGGVVVLYRCAARLGGSVRSFRDARRGSSCPVPVRRTPRTRRQAERALESAMKVTLIDKSEVGRHGGDRLAGRETPPSFLKTSVQMICVEGKAVRVLKPARQLKATHPGDGRQFVQRDILLDVILEVVSNPTQYAIVASRCCAARWLINPSAEHPKASMQQFV